MKGEVIALQECLKKIALKYPEELVKHFNTRLTPYNATIQDALAYWIDEEGKSIDKKDISTAGDLERCYKKAEELAASLETSLKTMKTATGTEIRKMA